MNKQQRKEWDELVLDATNAKQALTVFTLDTFDQISIILANAYILKLERELQNIKGGRKVAAILKTKVEQ